MHKLSLQPQSEVVVPLVLLRQDYLHRAQPPPLGGRRGGHQRRGRRLRQDEGRGDAQGILPVGALRPLPPGTQFNRNKFRLEKRIEIQF